MNYDDDAISIMLNAAPVCGSVWNRDGCCVDCNEAALRFFGLGSKQQYLDHNTELSTEYQPGGGTSASLWRSHLHKAFAEGRAEFPWQHRRFDGRLIPARVTLTRIVHGGCMQVVAYAVEQPDTSPMDVSARERALLMLDNAPLACTFWNANGELIDCNLAALKRYNIGSKEALIACYADFSPEFQPDGGNSVVLTEQYVNQALQTGRVTTRWMHVSAAGEPMPCEATLVRVIHNNEPMVASFIRDLREETRLAAEKREAEERMQIMLDASPFGCTLWDEESQPIDCNKAAVKLFGLTSKQEWVDHFDELAPERQPGGGLTVELIPFYVQQAHRDGYVRFDWMVQTPDGETIPTEVTLVRVQRPQGSVVIAYLRDLREEKKLQAEKRAADERMQIMLDATPLGCSFWDEKFRLIDCNAEVVRLFGLINKQEFLARFLELSPVRQPDGQLTVDAHLRYIQQAHRDGFVRLEWMHQKPGGEMLPAEVTLVRVQRAQGHVIAAYVRDLREELKLQIEKNEANEYSQLMLDATPLCCNLWDEEHNNIACNQEAMKLFELSSRQEYLDRFFELSPEYQPSGRLSSELAHEHIDTAFRNGYTRFEWMHQKLSGEPMPAEIVLVRIQRGKSCIVAGYTRDQRELRSSAASLKRLEALAFTDKLTGVANRQHFLERATAILENLNVGGSASLMILDIDHFKQVNDTYGHSGGDAILQGLAERIQETLRPDDLFARYGGEEFVILLGRARLDVALALAERVREAIAHEPFEYHGNAIKITISIGISDCGYPAPTLQDMVDRADAALYQAKHNGRNRVECSPP